MACKSMLRDPGQQHLPRWEGGVCLACFSCKGEANKLRHMNKHVHHIYIHVICTCIHIHLHVHLYIYIYIYVYRYVYTYLSMYIYLHMHEDVHIHSDMYLYVCVHIYTYVYAHVYRYIHIQNMCIYIYIYMYIHRSKQIHAISYFLGLLGSVSRHGACIPAEVQASVHLEQAQDGEGTRSPGRCHRMNFSFVLNSQGGFT